MDFKHVSDNSVYQSYKADSGIYEQYMDHV